MPALFIPGVHDYKKPEPEQPECEPIDMQRITAEAEREARKSSTNPSPKDS